jgi:hypothetical protein
MDPSKLIEDMFLIEHNLRWGRNNQLDYLDALGGDRARSKSVWDVIKVNLVQAVPFHFQDIGPEPVHTDFAEQLIQHQLLHPPFQSTLISSSLLPRVYFLCGVARGQLVIVTFSYFGGGEMPKDVIAPAYVTCSTAEFTADVPLVNIVPLLDKATPAENEKSGTWAFQTAASHLALLMSKEIADRVEPSPVKLNKKRAKAGRPPIPERHTITIRAGVRAALATASHVPGDGRASPRMHWRRGHLRHLATGVILKIPPVVVNAREEAQPTIKQYIIKKGELL